MDNKQAGRLSVIPAERGIILAMWRGDTHGDPLAFREMSHAEAEYLLGQLKESLREWEVSHPGLPRGLDRPQ